MRSRGNFRPIVGKWRTIAERPLAVIGLFDRVRSRTAGSVAGAFLRLYTGHGRDVGQDTDQREPIVYGDGWFRNYDSDQGPCPGIARVAPASGKLRSILRREFVLLRAERGDYSLPRSTATRRPVARSTRPISRPASTDGLLHEKARDALKRRQTEQPHTGTKALNAMPGRRPRGDVGNAQELATSIMIRRAVVQNGSERRRRDRDWLVQAEKKVTET